MRRRQPHQAGGAGAGVDRERGSALVWLLLIVPVLFAFGGLVLDGGRVITSRQTAANVAEQAARLAVDELNRDTFRGSGQVGAVDLPAAQTAACGYSATAGPAASCSTTLTPDGQLRVEVTITTQTALLGAVGISSLTVRGSGTARPAIGANQEVRP